jgi:hypothetical protein
LSEPQVSGDRNRVQKPGRDRKRDTDRAEVRRADLHLLSRASGAIEKLGVS